MYFCICVFICICVYTCVFVYSSVFVCIYLNLCGIGLVVMQLWASQATGSAAPIPPSHSDAPEQIVYCIDSNCFVTYNSISHQMALPLSLTDYFHISVHQFLHLTRMPPNKLSTPSPYSFVTLQFHLTLPLPPI